MCVDVLIKTNARYLRHILGDASFLKTACTFVDVQGVQADANLFAAATAAHAMVLCALQPAPTVLHQLALGASWGGAFNHLESSSAKPAIETASLDTFCDQCAAPIPATEFYWENDTTGKVGCRGCRDASGAGGQSADSDWRWVPLDAKVTVHAQVLGIGAVVASGSSSNTARNNSSGSGSGGSKAKKAKSSGNGGGGGVSGGGGGGGKAKSSSASGGGGGGGSKAKKAKCSDGAGGGGGDGDGNWWWHL
jgi:uncharacterized membrane protein YgcG